MAFLKTIGGFLSTGLTHITGMISNPFQISEISNSACKNWEIVIKEKVFILYKDRNVYKAVLYSSPHKSFLIFQLPNLDEAKSTFHILSNKLQILYHSSSISSSVSDLQKISDLLRQHPTYGCAHIAAFVGLANCLSEQNILFSINDADEETGQTPLHIAIEQENIDCIQELMFLNARHSSVDKNGQTVLHLAAKCKNPDIIKMLASKDASFINQLNKVGETALHEACLNGLHENVEMLLRWKIDPLLTQSYRYPIHCAVAADSIKCVTALNRWNSKLMHSKDKSDGNSSLHIAESREMIHCLIELGCSMELQNLKNRTPLLAKVVKGDLAVVLALLICGADVSARDADDNGVVHLAIQLDRPELVQTLIVFGGDVNLCSKMKVSPRHQAACSSGTNSELILHYLHMVGAVRCDKIKHGCMDGCIHNGSFDGRSNSSTTSVDKISTVVDQYSEISALNAALSRSGSCTNFETHVGKPGDRVLCLDGGGIRGLVSIKILMAIENITGQPIQKSFDWIGGTSTGSILTVGLLQGKTLNYMLGAYFRLKDEVFQGKRPYNSEFLETFIKREFGEWSRMTDIKHPKIMLTSVVADRMPAELYIFKNYEIPGIDHNPLHSAFKRFPPIPQPQDQLVWQAVRASGAAPTYFRANGRFIDGGLVSNNPTLDVLTEIHKCNVANKAAGNIKDISPLHVVVSVGTGNLPQRFIEACDIFRPEGILDFTKVFSGVKNLGELLINQATQPEGQSVSRAAAWCNMIDVPFFRFSPQLLDFVSLDCIEDGTLVKMLWETQAYLQQNHEKLVQLGNLLL